MGNRPSRQARKKAVLDEFSLAGKKLHLSSAEDVQEHVKLLNNVVGVSTVLLSGNTFGVAASKALASALELHQQIRTVNLSDCFTGRLKEEVPPALEAFGTMLRSRPVLVRLDLSDNAFGPSGAKAVSTFLPHCLFLKELCLNNNGLGVDGGKLIASALVDLKTNLQDKPSNLRLLTIGRNRLENGSAEALAQAFEAHADSLESIAMYQNGIRPEGIIKLAQSLAKCTRLRYVDLQDNTFTDSASRVFAAAIPNWTLLETLNIGDCLLGAEGSRAIIDNLCQGEKPIAASIKSLNMQYGEMSELCAQCLADNLEKFASLQQLVLNGNSFSATGRAGLAILTKLKAVGKEGLVDEWDDMEVESEEEEEAESEEESEKEEPPKAAQPQLVAAEAELATKMQQLDIERPAESDDAGQK